MKVLIVSDTHGRDENLEIAINREAPFDMLVHCGDVEGREIFIEALAEESRQSGEWKGYNKLFESNIRATSHLGEKD